MGEGNLPSIKEIMRISPNFTLNELTKSSTAMRLDIDNTPSMEHLVAMTALCHKIAQPIRDEFGVVTVNSCYRSPDLNKAVKGSGKSQHCKGQAIDLEVMRTPNDELAAWIYNNLEFDQLILEYFDPKAGDPNLGWVHVSYTHESSEQRKNSMLINKNSNGYQPWEPN